MAPTVQSKVINSATDNRSWEFSRIDAKTVRLVETGKTKQHRFFPDVSNELWIAAYFVVTDTTVRFKVEDEVLTLSRGRYLLFKPPFTITELGFKADITLHALLSQSKLPMKTPDRPTIFDASGLTPVFSLSDVASLLKKETPLHDVSRYSPEKVRGITNSIKKRIDIQYHTTISLSEIARSLGISSNLLSMYFKGDYHISPSQYRKQLRLKSSVLQLLADNTREHTIAEIANNCGYNDISRYNKQFKAFTSITPTMVRG